MVTKPDPTDVNPQAVPFENSAPDPKPRPVLPYLAIGAGVTAIVFLIIIIGVLLADRAEPNQPNINTGKNYVPPATATPLPSTPIPTPTPNYDIPELRAFVEGIKLFEAGSEPPDLGQRDYSATFEKRETRRIDCELKLGFPPASATEIPLDYRLYKGATYINKSSYAIPIVDGTESKFVVTEFGQEVSGGWETGNYRIEVWYGNKKIKEKSFVVTHTEFPLAGYWYGGTGWEQIEINGRDADYSGTYSYSSLGTFRFSKTGESTYTGTWSGWGDGRIKAVVSMNGSSMAITWNNGNGPDRNSTWLRRR